MTTFILDIYYVLNRLVEVPRVRSAKCKLEQNSATILLELLGSGVSSGLVQTHLSLFRFKGKAAATRLYPERIAFAYLTSDNQL